MLSEITMNAFVDEHMKIAKAMTKAEKQERMKRYLKTGAKGALGFGVGYGAGTLLYHGARKLPSVQRMYTPAQAAKRLRYLKGVGAVLGTGLGLAMSKRQQVMRKERELPKTAGAAKALTHPGVLLGGLGAATGAITARKGQSRAERALRGGAAGAMLGTGIRHLPKVFEKSKHLKPHAKSYSWIVPSVAAAPVVSGVG